MEGFLFFTSPTARQCKENDLVAVFARVVGETRLRSLL